MKISFIRLKTLLAIPIMLLTAALLVSCAHGEPGKKGPDIKAMRKEAANRQRRVIFNNDGCDAICFPEAREANAKNLIAIRSLPLLGSHVDTISYCTISSGFGNFTHNTKIGNILTGPHPDPGTKNITQELIDQGTDTLETMVDFCRENDLEIFWTMRMNDTHDYGHSPDNPYFLFPPLKSQHPEYLIGSYENKPRYGSWTSVNYGLSEVRDLAFGFIEEVCRNYDIDGLDLDFCRHYSYFKSVAYGGKATQGELDMMTDLMRKVRRMADQVGLQRGKPILIAVRAPDSVEYSRAIGIDIERWLAEGLVDILFTTDYFRLNSWDYSVDLARKYGVKVYPCITDSRIAGQGKRRNPVRTSQPAYRARAMEAWQANPDGIYVHNDYNARAGYLWEIGEPQQLQKLDKLYFATFMNGRPHRYLANGNEFMNRKLVSPADALILKPQVPERIEMIIGDDLSWTKDQPVEPEVKCRLRFTGIKSADQIDTSLNGRLLKNGKLSGEWLEYSVDPENLRKGKNILDITLAQMIADQPDQPETWDMTYDCDNVLSPPEQLPWRRLFEVSDWVEKAEDGIFYFADRDKGKSNWIGLAYPWQISPGGKAAVEARVKVESSTDPLGVCIRVSNSQSVEYLMLEKHSIGLKFANVTYPMDTTSDFHTYRIVVDGKDIMVYVDGELKINGTGKFTASALDESQWITFSHGLDDWNKNCLFFGSASGTGTGAAYWDHIKFRAKKLSLIDVAIKISYKKKG